MHDLLYDLNTESIDIICITESWLKPCSPDSLLLGDNRNYTVFRKDHVDSQGGGVCILSRTDTVKAVRVDISSNFKDIDILCIDILNACPPVRLIVGYRPPPCSDTDQEAIQYTNLFCV